MALLAARLRSMDSQLADSVFLDVTGRTAKRLLDLAADQDEFLLPITQEELAGMVGASRERVNKAIASFVRLGWIDQSDRRYRILDREQITRRASQCGPVEDHAQLPQVRDRDRAHPAAPMREITHNCRRLGLGSSRSRNAMARLHASRASSARWLGRRVVVGEAVLGVGVADHLGAGGLQLGDLLGRGVAVAAADDGQHGAGGRLTATASSGSTLVGPRQCSGTRIIP